MQNCDLTSNDSRRAQQIEGKDKFSLRGKNADRHKKKNPRPIIVNAPEVLLSGIGPVRLHVDTMHVNENAFLHDISDDIRLWTVQHVKSRFKFSMQTNLQDVIRQHNVSSFTVKHADVDMEFECLEDSMPSMSFDIVAPDDHESVVERSTCTEKDGARCLV